ncbi:MAG: hypothetical protein IKX40_11110 [Thermoguttaceae bacterium]|nr:hypothetical protein [Thermoguttaceae bacterium]
MGRKKRHSDRYDWEDEDDDLTPESVSVPQKTSPLQSRVAALAKQRKEQENSASSKESEQTKKTVTKQEPKKKPERKAKPKNNEPKPPFFVRLSYLITWLTALTFIAACIFISAISARELFNSANSWLYQKSVYCATIAILFWVYLLQFQYLFLISRRGRQAITSVWIYVGAVAAFVFAAATTAQLTHKQVNWQLIQITLVGAGVWLVGIINKIINNWRQKKLLDLSFAKKEDFVPVKWLSLTGWIKKLIAILVFFLILFLTTMDVQTHGANSEEQSAPQTLESNTQSQMTLESSLHENRPD